MINPIDVDFKLPNIWGDVSYKSVAPISILAKLANFPIPIGIFPESRYNREIVVEMLLKESGNIPLKKFSFNANKPKFVQLIKRRRRSSHWTFHQFQDDYPKGLTKKVNGTFPIILLILTMKICLLFSFWHLTMKLELIQKTGFHWYQRFWDLEECGLSLRKEYIPWS